MGYMKKVMAILLVLSMTLCLAFGAMADVDSPTQPGTNADNPGDVSSTSTASNGAVVEYLTQGETLDRLGATKEVSETVVISDVPDANGKRIPIQVIGNGKLGVFNTKAGRQVTNVKIASSVPVIVNGKAFTKSNVSKLNTEGDVTLKKNALKDTKKNVTIYTDGKLKAQKGAFNGKKVKKIVCNSKKMTKAEFKAFKKAMKKAGYKGKFAYKAF